MFDTSQDGRGGGKKSWQTEINITNSFRIVDVFIIIITMYTHTHTHTHNPKLMLLKKSLILNFFL